MRAKVWFSGKTHLRQRSPIRMPRIGYSGSPFLSIQPAESLYGSLEMSKTFLEMLATMLQTPESFSWDLQRCCKRQKVFRGTCNSVANARKFFVGLATVLQTSESFSWDLQQCCKRQKIFRGTCNGVANARKFFVRLATVLQTLKSSSGHLQHSCKRQKILRGTCSIPANTFKTDFGFYSALSKTCFGDKTPHSFVELTLRIE